MHQTRAGTNRNIPIPRKGNKYVARGIGHSHGVPVVIAVRDMLQLARTTREVKKLIHEKKIKLNGKDVKDERETIRLFNVIEAGKKYNLTILTTGKFGFEETKNDYRIAKIVNKKLVKGSKTQVIFHDGTNKIMKEKTSVGDSVYIGFDGKVSKIIPIEKGQEVIVSSGRNIGMKGKIKEVSGSKAVVNVEGRAVTLESKHIIAL